MVHEPNEDAGRCGAVDAILPRDMARPVTLQWEGGESGGLTLSKSRNRSRYHGMIFRAGRDAMVIGPVPFGSKGKQDG
jgi:hypothetical protein